VGVGRARTVRGEPASRLGKAAQAFVLSSRPDRRRLNQCPSRRGSARGKTRLAIAATHLARNQPAWVMRRIDHISYVDDTTVRWRVSVTCRWPEPTFFPRTPAEGG